jgi:hypothetical protein
VERVQRKELRYEALRYEGESRQSASLSVVTADGDTVKISIEGLQRVQMASLDARKGGRQANYASGGAESRLAVSIDVEGSLDQQEAADIGKLLEQLAGAVETARGGGAEAVQAAPVTVADSLLNYEFAYSEESAASYSVSGAVVRRAAPRYLREAA